MAEDVILRGDLVEYLNAKRCEACQEGNRKCIMETGTDVCLLCSDSGRSCMFERPLRVRGPAKFIPADLMSGRTDRWDIKSNLQWVLHELLSLYIP